MDIEQRRNYIERTSSMGNDSLLNESKKLGWRINLTGYGAVASFISFSVLVGYGINHLDNLVLILPAAAAILSATFLGNKSSEYMHKSNVVNFQLHRRGFRMRLCSFQRVGLAIMGSLDSTNSPSS